MSAAAKSVSAIGFLAAVEHAEFGIFGGYLILNTAGRPLEFHCTAPVKANRAQEILYGPTLREYLYEQIAPALLAKARTPPFMVCTDSTLMLSAAAASAVPTVQVRTDSQEQVEGLLSITLGENEILLPQNRAAEQPDLERFWREANAERLDLGEPFGRIREALEEAQRAARTAA